MHFKFIKLYKELDFIYRGSRVKIVNKLFTDDYSS